jgi:cytochrome c oxidase cbb3-type subunit III
VSASGHIVLAIAIMGAALTGFAAAQAQQPAPNQPSASPSVSVQYRQPPATNPYAGQPEAIAEGRRLFTQYNCVGCHAPGAGGAMGPSLLDGERIYGSAPGAVFQTILLGRPHGMPSFERVLTPDQIWKLAAYLESLHSASGSASPATERGATR